MSLHATSAWNEGETEMHSLLRAPHGQNPTSRGLPAGRYGRRVMQAPLVALGTLDEAGQPWTTVWGGERGFTRLIAEDVLGVNSAVARATDPVFQALFAGADADTGMVRPDPEGDEENGGGGGSGTAKMLSGLAIDMESRDRVKLAGRLLAGAAGPETEGRAQLAFAVTESLGNCPKYITKKSIVPHDAVDAEARIASEGFPLPREAVDLIDRADILFISSTDGRSMDTNNRGGPPGFMRVLRNDEGGVELIYPEYSGNRLYQTLGNLKMSPRVGIAVPDFDNGNVLYVSGTASILVGDEATALLPRTKLAIKVTVASARYVHAGLPFRGVFIEYSPYNPPVRYLLSERAPAATLSGGKSLSAVLSGRQILTPNVARFTFKLTAPLPKGGGWKPGQHVTLDFSEELDMGYSHMADHAPQSINDDFVRTFTVSSALPRDGSGDSGDSGDSSSSTTITPTFDITVRRHGPATNLLWRQPLRVPLEVPVLGFGGKDDFHLPMVNGDAGAVFVAGGVGITPVLAQARLVLDAAVDFRLLWSLRDEDLGLAVDTFTRIDGLAAATTLFVTGAGTDTADLQTVKDMGVRVEQRRVGEEDLQGLRGKGLRFYLCAAPALVKRITTWIEGESVVWEDFGY